MGQHVDVAVAGVARIARHAHQIGDGRTQFMVPTMLNAINRIPGIERQKFPDLECMMVSTAPISDETVPKAYEIFGDAMYQGYGQTEILPVAMMGPRQWFAKDVAGSQLLRSSTAERMVDGWGKTGDIGRLDANGCLYMLDRADDMVILGGFNIHRPNGRT